MSLPAYHKYKESGVEWLGKIPAHWCAKPLKYSIHLQNGEDHKSIEQNEGVPVLGSGGPFSYASRWIYDGESILLGRKGTIDKPIYINGKFWTVDTMYWSIILDNSCGKFIYYLSTTIPFSYYSTNTALPSMTKSVLHNHIVSCPPLDEQKAIAAFLDRETEKIDALIAEQEKLLDLLAEKREATISRAVTRGLNPNAPMKDSGIAWLGEVPEHWKLPPLYMRYSSELGKMLDEARISGQNSLPYLRNADVQWGRINYDSLPQMDIRPDEYDRYTVRTGDLLVCEGGEVGRASIVEDISHTIGFQKALHRLRAISAEEIPKYMFYVFLWASRVGAFSGEGQSTIAHLTGQQLKKLRFPQPPADEQRAIACFLDIRCLEFDELRSEAMRSIAILKERRSALIAAAVTGKIDVRGTISENKAA